MKVYILKDDDFAKLRAEIGRNPVHGTSGGEDRSLNEEERTAYKKAHRFYRYLIERWMDSVT